MKFLQSTANSLRTLALISFVGGGSALQADDTLRTIVVRERAETLLQNGAVAFKLLKINGYSIEVKTAQARLRLTIGQSFAPEGANCTVFFEEIATETRLARFVTDCS